MEMNFPDAHCKRSHLTVCAYVSCTLPSISKYLTRVTCMINDAIDQLRRQLIEYSYRSHQQRGYGSEPPFVHGHSWNLYKTDHKNIG